MFNLNIPTTPSLLGVDSGGGICTTPKTPEILNSLIAMTNPLDNYTFAISPTSTTTTPTATGAAQTITQSINNHQIISQDSSHSSSSGSPLDSPAGTNTTPSVQQTCSQLIKAGLKLSIQSKRKMSSGDSSSGNEQPMSKCARQSTAGDDTSDDDDTESHKSPRTGLTPEDEDRRRRRRERNKIAATKCRMKKRERTLNLVSESEQLETQNVELKSQVKNLETERRKLFDMLQSHSPSCIRPGGYNPPPNLCQSPACKYLNDIGMCDQQNGVSNNNNNDQQDHTHHQRTTIPSMNTIKYSRNGLRHNNNHNNTNNSNNNNNNNNTNNNSSNNNSQIITTTNTSDLQLPNGYCKPSPTTHEIGYLNSPTQDVVIGSCLHSQLTNGHHNHQQQQQQHQQQQQQQQQQHLQNHHQNHHQHQQQQHDHQQQHLQTTIIKTDYIPNCENSNGGTTVDSTTDFVLKSELVDAQSPYTTVQSADRFLFEADCENFDIKCNGNSNNNNNNNLNTNNNNTMDFHPQIATTPTTCQSYDSLLIKNDFLTDNSELLAQLTDGTDSEFTDLDSGVTAYAHITNGGCLA